MRVLLKKYVAEFVYGGIDGSVTTFAIVSGTLGAALSPSIILILGFANLFADGFSMAVSNYLSEKSDHDLSHMENRVHEHRKEPVYTALATFISFVIVGFIPLLSFVIAPFSPFFDQYKFLFSIVATGIAFMIVGAIKGTLTHTNRVYAAVTTLALGGGAALISYYIGYLLRNVA